MISRLLILSSKNDGSFIMVLPVVDRCEEARKLMSSISHLKSKEASHVPLFFNRGEQNVNLNLRNIFLILLLIKVSPFLTFSERMTYQIGYGIFQIMYTKR